MGLNINFSKNSFLMVESIGQSLAYMAIKNHEVIRINYKSDDDSIASGERIIEPYVLGRTSKNNVVIRAFQPYGDTESSVPNWKLFKLNNIISWKPTNKTFNSEPNKRGFNVQPYDQFGDSQLKMIRIQATFENDINNKNSKENVLNDKSKNKMDVSRDNLLKQNNQKINKVKNKDLSKLDNLSKKNILNKSNDATKQKQVINGIEKNNELNNKEKIQNNNILKNQDNNLEDVSNADRRDLENKLNSNRKNIIDNEQL